MCKKDDDDIHHFLCARERQKVFIIRTYEEEAIISRFKLTTAAYVRTYTMSFKSNFKVTFALAGPHLISLPILIWSFKTVSGGRLSTPFFLSGRDGCYKIVAE